MRSLSFLLPMVVVACGIDALGTKVEAEPIASTPVNDAAPGPAPSDGGPSLDADDARDGSMPPPLGPLCPADAQGLVACFAFEDSAADGSPSPLVPLSAANLGYGAGREGQAAIFAPSPKTDMRLPHASMNTTAMTIEVWLKPASMPATGERYSIVDMEGRFGVNLQPDGTFRCRSLATTKKASVGTWTHLACVNDGATMFAYVDGALDGSVANVLGTTSDFIGIGQDSTSTNDTFDGMIDNLRIWTRGLSAAEVGASAAR